MSYTPIKFSETSATGINSDTVISGGNWVGNTYTGTWETNEYAYAGINLQVDEPGTLYFDFTQDADASPVENSSYPVNGFTIAAGINEVHTAWKGSRGFRVRFVGDDGSRSYFRLKTFYSNHPLPLSTPVNQSIGTDQDATVVRAISEGLDPNSSFAQAPISGVDDGNSTTVTLGSSQAFTGTWKDIQGFHGITVLCDGTAASAADGTLEMQFSHDGSTIHRNVSISIADIASAAPRTLGTVAQYFRIVYTNGTTAHTSTDIQTMLHTQQVQLVSRANQTIGADADVSNVRSITTGEDPSGTFVNSKADGIAFASQTTLNNGQAYESGILDARGFTQVQTHVTASHDGTMQFNFYATQDSPADLVRSLTVPYVAANGFQLFSAPAFSDYVEYVFTNDSGSNQTDFHFETKLLTKSLSGQVLALNAPVLGGMVANVGRSVIVGQDGAGDYGNVEIDRSSKAIKTQITGPLSGFGEVQVSQIVPQTQLMFPYGVNPLLIDTRNNGGSTTTSNGKITCSTGAAANQCGGFVSKNVGKYNPGQGHIARFTGAFTTGVAGSSQFVGIGDAFEGFFFGYDGDTGSPPEFGILHRKGGRPQIVTLTVTTGTTTTDNVTITLNGDSTGETVALGANGGDAALTAYDIAAHDYSGVGDGWTATAVGPDVIFTSWSAGPKAIDSPPDYTVTNIDTELVVDPFVETLAGVDATDTFIAQSSWSEDLADGTGSLPVMDFTKGNVFQIQFQYLGYGAIEYYIEKPSTGEFILVHRISYANAFDDPSLSNASLPLSALVKNTTNTSDVTLSLASMMSGSEGLDRLPGIRRATSASRGSIAQTELPVLSIHSSEVFNGVPNRIPIKINSFRFGNDHAQAMILRVYIGAKLTGASFTDLDTNVSPIKQDVSATAVDVTNARLLYTTQLGGQENDTIDLTVDQLAGDLDLGDILTITAESVSQTGEVAVSINWVEEQ